MMVNIYFGTYTYNIWEADYLDSKKYNRYFYLPIVQMYVYKYITLLN